VSKSGDAAGAPSPGIDVASFRALRNSARSTPTSSTNVVEWCDGLLQLAALQARKRVEDEVSEFLTGEKFGYSFKGKRTLFGFRRDDRVYSTLSGAEWVRCISALAVAVARRVKAEHPTTLAVYVVPDRALDDNSVRAL